MPRRSSPSATAPGARGRAPRLTPAALACLLALLAAAAPALAAAEPAPPPAAAQPARAGGDDGDKGEEDDGADEDDGKDDGGDETGPLRLSSVYLDLEGGWSSTPGTTVGFSLRRLRQLTGRKTRGVHVSAPLTFAFGERLTLTAGLDGSMSRALTEPWSDFLADSWSVSIAARLTQQQGLLPEISVNGSLSRPVQAIAGTRPPTWAGGLDLDWSLDAEGERGVSASFSVSRTVSPVSRLRIGMLYDASLGYYWSPAQRVNVTVAAGAQHFAGAEISAVADVRVKPVTTPYVQLEIEHVDRDDNRLFALSLMAGWSPAPQVQLGLSAPLYLWR
ncbi:hypothetical protein ACFFJB_10955 [Camelimonas abortus]|uniref:Outer membrane beta-barrel porin/alpha-amylase n=1 Tax=Camelimonas abortus TaxID=1017184 RepID=A0ABV7LBK8_9HYPH